MTSLSNDELRDQLADAIEGSRLMAEAAAVTAAHFRPQFDACWNGGEPGKGDIDMAAYNRLRPYVIDKESEAKNWENDRALLAKVLAALDAKDAEIGRLAKLLQPFAECVEAIPPGLSHNVPIDLSYQGSTGRTKRLGMIWTSCFRAARQALEPKP